MTGLPPAAPGFATSAKSRKIKSYPLANRSPSSLYLSEDLEDQYTYFLSTVTADGRTLCLSAYSGPTGPVIGGEQNEASRAAADALAALINSASPADYDYEGYYLDGPCRVRMGVRNGVPYMEEDELSDEEFEQILRKTNNR